MARRSVLGSMPQPLDEVYNLVYEALAQNAAGHEGAEALKLLAEIIGELKAAYTVRCEDLKSRRDGTTTRGGDEMISRLGELLPLRCGHNMPLRRDEMEHVKAFLTREG